MIDQSPQDIQSLSDQIHQLWEAIALLQARLERYEDYLIHENRRLSGVTNEEISI